LKIFYVSFILLVTTLGGAAQQTSSISGTVADLHGEPIAHALVKCGAQNTATDVDGKFRIDTAKCESLTVTAEGFETTTSRTATDLNVILHPSAIFANVTVGAISTTLAESAPSVAVVDKRALDTSAAPTLDDRLRQVPGFSLFRRAGSRTANPTTQGVSLRGVGASGASRALVIKDGVPLNDQFGSWVFWGRVPSESIAEVEIVRGPASDLYGTAAVGGVISVRTRQIGDSPFASFDLSYGSQQTPFGSGFASDRWQKWGGSLAGEYLKTNGFITVAPEQRGPIDTLANVRRSSIAPTVERKVGVASRIFLSGDFYRELRANGTPRQRNDTRMNNFVAGGDAGVNKAGDLTLRIFGGTEKYHQTFSAISADRRTEALNRLQSAPSQSFGISGRWMIAHGKNVYFAGADHRKIRGRSDEIGIANGVANVATSSGGREISAAAYVGLLVRPSERLTLSGGVRYDRWKETIGFSASRSLITHVLTLTAFPDRARSAVSPRGSLLYRINKNISLAATAAGGFRQPTLNELYRSFRVGNVLTLANENLRAERAVNGEAAVIVNAFDERFYLRAGPFCTRVTDTISNVTIIINPNLITRQRQNLGVTRSCGFEADAVGRARRDLTLTAGYLHVDSKVREMPGNPTLVGLRLPQVPHDQGTMQLRYSDLKFGSFSTQLRASSPQFDDDLNQLPLKAYIAIDAFASHQLGRRTSIYLAAENIFDTRIQAGRTPVLTLAGPRAVRIGLRVRFGGE
jgi:outer membrane receptor protein involved in Fe transport